MAMDMSLLSNWSSGYSYQAFGNTENVLRRASFPFDYNETTAFNGQYYEPRINLRGLASMLDASPHHARALYYKTEQVIKTFVPKKIKIGAREFTFLTREKLKQIVFDRLHYGHGYGFIYKNIGGYPIGIAYKPTYYIRRLAEFNRYGMLENSIISPFNAGDVFQWKAHDPLSSIYGRPEWLACLQALLMQEDSLLIPRRDFEEGTREKMILTAGMSTNEHTDFKASLKETKGGRRQTVAINFLKANDIDKVIKVINAENPLKTDFVKYGQYAQEIINECHNMPRYMDNEGGSVDPDKVRKTFYQDVIVPIQEDIKVINDYIPQDLAIEFATPAEYQVSP
jgi:capsid portal protein